jgi:hypothetical protein
MKAKILLAGLVVFLATSGSTCINDTIIYPLDLKLPADFLVNPGGAYNSSVYVLLDTLVDEQYREDIKDARFYDIQLSVSGAYTGTVSGNASIRWGNMSTSQVVCTYSGPWSAFQTPQSILSGSPYITPVAAGMTSFRDFLKSASNGPALGYFSAAGSLTPASTTQLQIHVRYFGQVDAIIKSGDGGGMAP